MCGRCGAATSFVCEMYTSGAGLATIGGEVGEDVGQEEDDESAFGFPEDGFDEGGQGRVEAAAEKSHYIDKGVDGRVEVRTMRDDGGDFGEADLP